ncbi:hypothetical protein V3C99_008601 [Haemonchus contortus]
MWILDLSHVIFVYTTMALSLTFNSVLIFFIHKHSFTGIGAFKAILFAVAGFNIMYSITMAVVMPVIHVYDLSFFLFTTGLGSIPEGASRLLVAVFCSLFAQSLCLLALQFVYRYVQVVRPSARFLFEEKSYLPIALYVITAFDYGAVCFFNFAPSPVKDVHFSEQMWYSYQLNVTKVGYLGPIYMLDGEVQWLDVSGLLNVSTVIGLTLAAIPFCGIATYRALYKHDAASEQTKQRQKQMFRLLLIQSFFPLAFTFVPSSAILVMSLFGRHIGARGNIVGMLLTVYPVIEPLVVLYFVGSYRKAIARYLGVGTHVTRRTSSVNKF